MSWLDRSGIVVSAVCALHCGITGLAVALPALTAAAVVMPGWLGDIDPWLMWVSLACAMGALAIGVYRHGQLGPLGVGMIGAMAWGLANLTLDHSPLAAAGAGIAFIVAHAWNLCCHRRHRSDCQKLNARHAGR